jgi:hypothetical protein
MKIMLSLMALFAVTLVGMSAPLTFQFSTTMDTTSFGGGSNTPLTVTYTFDSALPNGSGPGAPISSTLGSYGPLSMEIRLGTETVAGSGGGISVFNNASASGLEDSYDVRLDSFSGQFFGRDLEIFRFLLVDESGTMFNATHLPLSPGFAAATQFQQTEFNFFDGSSIETGEDSNTPTGDRRPLTLSTVPEPSTGGLLGIGLTLIAGRLRLRRFADSHATRSA